MTDKRQISTDVIKEGTTCFVRPFVHSGHHLSHLLLFKVTVKALTETNANPAKASAQKIVKRINASMTYVLMQHLLKYHNFADVISMISSCKCDLFFNQGFISIVEYKHACLSTTAKDRLIEF